MQILYVNVSFEEIVCFDKLVVCWWDLDGELCLLYDFNLVCVVYVVECVVFKGVKVVDVGCGGGLLSEVLVCDGVQVIGIDLGKKVIEIVKLYLYELNFVVDYCVQFFVELVVVELVSFDVVCCMEMIEYVFDLEVLVNDLVVMFKLGGWLFMFILNCMLVVFGVVILGVEYLMCLLLCGMYYYVQFFKLLELVWLLCYVGLELEDVLGLVYNLFICKVWLSCFIVVNYVLCVFKLV